MSRNDLVVIAGAGGFIGGHLVADFRRRGYTRLRAVDIKPFDEWYQRFADVENLSLDLSEKAACERTCEGASHVYNLAADMGGMGFIELNKALCMLTVLINTHMLMAARQAGAQRYFFSSSACVYAAEKQTNAAVTPLREDDAYPAMPEDGYGWEKLFSERMCRHFSEDFGLETRVARYHNVYGPYGTYDGGREKAPAAVCRKIAQAAVSGDHRLEIWGDGEQTRSFMFIDDCVQGSQMILAGDSAEPVNLGSDELVSINQLYSIVEEIAGITCTRRYQLDAPQGVRGRNSDNTMIKDVYGWAPSISLADGLARTYAWVYDEVKRSLG